VPIHPSPAHLSSIDIAHPRLVASIDRFAVGAARARHRGQIFPTFAIHLEFLPWLRFSLVGSQLRPFLEGVVGDSGLETPAMRAAWTDQQREKRKKVTGDPSPHASATTRTRPRHLHPVPDGARYVTQAQLQEGDLGDQRCRRALEIGMVGPPAGVEPAANAAD